MTGSDAAWPPDRTVNMTNDPMQDSNEPAALEPVDELEALRARIEQLEAQKLIDLADLENRRKRLERDIDNARKFANERLLGSLLPVFDSLDAGLATVAEADSPLRQGLELTRQQLLKVAGENGMEIVDPVGETFNPDFHQAISQGEAEGVAPGHVINVFQKGYVLNGRLLRPALVIVASHE